MNENTLSLVCSQKNCSAGGKQYLAADLLSTGTMCMRQCPYNVTYIEDGFCRSHCVASPFYRVEDQAKICVASCAGNSCASVDENGLLRCQECPDDRLWPAGGLCNAMCPPGTAFNKELDTCTESCPSLYYVDENNYPQCVSACPDGFNSVLNGTFGRRCMSSCPPGTTREKSDGPLRECVDDMSTMKAHTAAAGTVLALSLVLLVAYMFILTYGQWKPKLVQCVAHLKKKRTRFKLDADTPKQDH